MPHVVAPMEANLSPPIHSDTPQPSTMVVTNCVAPVLATSMTINLYQFCGSDPGNDCRQLVLF